MNETEKRIAKYKGKLPHLKEKVAAVSVLLAMSATMLTTVSFAWMALSKSPEVTDVNTSIAANGNLEIALVGAEGSIPAMSAVGDSNKNLIERNITWGNLINLSDPIYGLDNLVLRPAQLNPSSLLTNPLYGAEYDADGRPVNFITNFGYATWVPPQDGKPGYFKISNDKGVRAISSVTIEAVGAAKIYQDMYDAAKSKNMMAANHYKSMTNNTKQMQSLATMMGLYMTARMNPGDANLSNPDCDVADIQNLRDMYSTFLECFDLEAEAMAAVINLHLFLKHGENLYTPWTKDDVYAKSDADIKAATGSNQAAITRLTEFKKDRNTIATDLEKLKTISGSGTSLKWNDSGINGIVNNLMNVGACTIGADNTPISSIGVSNAMGYLSGTQEARITNGILYRFEERVGDYIEVKGLAVSAKVKRAGITIPATVTANIQTTAPRDYNLFSNDLNYADSLNTGEFQGGEKVANDTYGLAVDLWVRTNAAGSYLTLEGNVLIETSEEPAMGVDSTGAEVELYTVTLTQEITEENGSTSTLTYSVDLYKKEAEDGTVTWYNASTHSALTEADLQGKVPVQKMVEVQTVVGYEGANRVWDGSAGLSVNSTTQGSGSCYVFYADTPEDQARSLKLLASMKVAFVDENGKLLGKAEMDTEHFYANNGKVIVPLVLASDCMIVAEDAEGNPIYAITALEQNVATRITALVYLDGTQLNNEDVLASADIQGKLNVQFGSTSNLNSMENEKLQFEEMSVSAEITGNNHFVYDQATEENPMTTTVEVLVDGATPTKVTAFFIRAINATQGSREETMEFTYDESSGKWKASYTFRSPGNYVLRSVQLDGVEYDLSNETLPRVTVEGFTVTGLSWNVSSGNQANLMTANTSISTELTLTFASDDAQKMPSTVVGRFIHREDGSVANVKFTYNPTTFKWTGTATFLKSGTYDLQYVVLDGEYNELPSSMWRTAVINLGMKVAVYTTSNTTFKYLRSDPGFEEKLDMLVRILNDAGEEITGMTDVKLYYRYKGSSAAGLDATLTWDPEAGYYKGEFLSQVGIYEFNYVSAKNGDTTNTIAKADFSPTFTIISPEPPKYSSHEVRAYQYSPNGDAWAKVTLTQSATATVKAYFTNTLTGETACTAMGVGSLTDPNTNAMEWKFTIPTNDNGKQDGIWQLVSLDVWGVYDADGTLYTEDHPMVFDLEDKNIETKVVQTVNVSFGSGQSRNFGATVDPTTGEVTVTGTFMEIHKFSHLNVDITDWQGEAIYDEGTNISVRNVKLTFIYTNGSSSTYGGYTSDGLTNATQGATIEVPLTMDSTHKHFVQSAEQSIQFAGTYQTTLTFYIGDTYSREINVSEDTLRFRVWSNKPTVKISSVSANPSGARYYLSSTPSSLNVITDTFNNTKIDDYNAVVYMYVTAQSGTLDQEQVAIQYPKVNLSLSGIPNTHSGVTVVFPSGNNTSNTFSFAAGGATATASIGAGTNGTFDEGFFGIGSKVTAWPKFYPAGKQTVNKITVVHSGITFNVELSNAITINNPQHLPFADFASTASGQTLPTTPGRIYSTPTVDGFKITLPGTQTWTEAKSESQNGDFVVQSGYPKNENVYTERIEDKGCDGKITYYTPYIKTTTVSKASSTTTTWTRTWRITGWKVGGTTYAPGETITITGQQTVTPVLSYTDGTKTTTSTTTTRTVIAFKQNGNESTTKPAGTKVDSVQGSTTDVAS